MASITIRNLDDDLKQALRERAARNGHSMEEEVRRLISNAVAKPAKPKFDIDEIKRKYSKKPAEPFDLKELTDELWEEGLRWPPS